MADRGPVTELNARFGSDGATSTRGERGHERLESAEVHRLTAVRPDGCSRTSPRWSRSDWMGPVELRARNLADNRSRVLTAGRNALGEAPGAPSGVGDLPSVWHAVRPAPEKTIRGNQVRSYILSKSNEIR
ncbi:hypothetical protein GCM10022252_63900 [Streptosporangium oxazolinicum]|uniref:Uncharacterized protein n=1 Tax=Streptosporangium oxazolinicum TaxID=909287 RepID=A0ABP8BEC9_9ACTN